jgi:predicted ATPase
LLIVEQPELHLHPQLQGELADVAVNSVNGNFRDHELGPVVVLETHSEAILLRVLRRIREGIIDPKKVAFYFVDRLPGSDSSYVDRMEINSDGEFTRPWPLSFSELRISER